MGSSLLYHAGALGDFLTTLPAMARVDVASIRGTPSCSWAGPTWRCLRRRAFLTRSGTRARPGSLRCSAQPGRQGTSLGARLAAFQSALLFSYALSALPASLRGPGSGEIFARTLSPRTRDTVVDLSPLAVLQPHPDRGGPRAPDPSRRAEESKSLRIRRRCTPAAGIGGRTGRSKSSMLLRKSCERRV